MRGFFLGSVGLLAFLGLASCAHEGAVQDGVLRKGNVVVKVPEPPAGWRRIDLEGADLAYRDDARLGSALVNVRCAHRDDDAPLSVLAGHLIMGTTAREPSVEDVVPFDGREALHTVLRAKLDGVPMDYDIYVMKKDGCLYDLVYVAPPERFAAGAADFERYAAGLHASSASAMGRPVATSSVSP